MGLMETELEFANVETRPEPPTGTLRPCNAYRDVFGGWRWEFIDGDGHMRDSPYSFDTYEECIEAAGRAGLAPRM
jgi:hypothetical protein